MTYRVVNWRVYRSFTLRQVSRSYESANVVLDDLKLDRNTTDNEKTRFV